MKKHTAISIGNRCASAQYRTDHFNLTKALGYKTCPFDLMFSTLSGVIDCLNTDFKFFCDPKLLQVNHLGMEDNHERFLIEHKLYKNWQFNHESVEPGKYGPELSQHWDEGPYTFVHNNFEKFIERYERRIANFKYYCESGYYVDFILFFYHEQYSKGTINELNCSIQKRFPFLDYKIIVVKVCNNTSPPTIVEDYIINKN